MSHVDSPISYLSLMKTHKTSLTNEDSWLISSLLALPVVAGSSTESLAQTLLEIFSGHSQFKMIKRVALVRRVGLSNQLTVMSSANRNELLNTMDVGYSCYVNGGGSLFSIKPHSVRFFKSAEDVVQNYAANGQPPQRSIARIAKMKLGGGVCSAISNGDQAIGFLFMNGNIKPADLASENLSILFSLVFEVVQKYFYKSTLSREYYQLAKIRREEYDGKRFNHMRLADSIRSYTQIITGTDAEITVGTISHQKSYLISHGNVAQIISRALAVLAYGKPANITVREVENVIEFRVSTLSEDNSIQNQSWQNSLDFINEDAKLLNLGLSRQTSSEFMVSLKVDKASSDANVNYSVESELVK